MKPPIQNPLLLLAIAGLITLYSCGKDEENIPSSDTRELLTTGTWMLTGYTIDPGLDTDGDGDTEMNLFKYFPDCRKDDTYTFNNNYLVYIDAEATKCDAADPQVTQWAWDLSADEKRMMYDGSEYTIAELNRKTLRLTRDEYYASTNKTHTKELVYTHKP